MLVREQGGLHGLRRIVTVALLREMLDSFEDTDMVEVNAVGNLAVHRSDEQIGYIDFGVAEKAVVYANEPTCGS